MATYSKTRELTIGPAGTALSVYHLTAHQNIDSEIQDISTFLGVLGTVIAPVAYSPSWTAAGSAPSLGNGSITGRYTQIGKTVFGNIYLVFGSTTTAGTGGWYFTFPVTAESTIKRVLIGNAAMVDAGVQEVDGATLLLIDTTKFAITKADGTLWGANVPLTMGSTDYIHIAFQFEAA